MLSRCANSECGKPFPGSEKVSCSWWRQGAFPNRENQQLLHSFAPGNSNGVWNISGCAMTAPHIGLWPMIKSVESHWLHCGGPS